ncbi:MAG TPA: anti-sigma factor, partial [Ilumatobacter sp.]|nr:anti-sigma factor [Ilumatobacter sp.]
MTDRPTNEEREKLLADARGGALEPQEGDELALLADVLGDSSTWAEPRPGLEDAVVRAVADAEPTATTSRTPTARGEATRRRRRVLASALVAAAVIATLVATVLVTRGGTSPDYEAQLRGTVSAPGAQASADITRNDAGFRITLDATGLPALRAGEYYQAWLKNPAGTLVPIGTFSSSDGRVTLWSVVSPKDFPTITVTIEATDNDQISSGRPVVVGDRTGAAD